jgi:hypothetical protein
MRVGTMKSRQTNRAAVRRLGAAALLAAGFALSGCVVYPSSYGYGGGYAAPAYYAPPVVVGGGA